MVRRIAVLAALVAAAPASAAAPWEGAPFSADPAALAAAAEALPQPRAAVDVLAEEGTFRFDATGAVTFTYRFVARPLTAEAARAYGQVQQSFAPWHQARPELRVRVVGPRGEALELDPRTVVEQADREGTGARRTLTAPLPGVRAGAVIEELAVVKDTAPAFDAGVSHRFWFGQGGPARLVRLTVVAPESLPLRFAVRGMTLAPKETRAGGIRTLVFERRDVPAVAPPDPGAPREVPAAPLVAFGWGRSWANVAARYGALWEERLRGDDVAAAAAKALGAAKLPRDEAARRITRFIHANVRPAGAPLGDGGVAPARPSETLARHAGRPEDAALLAVALLRAAGLDGRIALLSTGWHEVLPELPGLGAFDHAVVRVAGSPPLWIDPSDAFTAPGRLAAAAEGRLALVTGPGAKELQRTPESGPADNTSTTTREIFLADLGPGRVVETRELTGALASAERAFRARLPPGRADDLDARYAREVFRAQTFLGSEVTGQEDASAPLRIRLEADGSAALETGDDEADVPATPDGVFEPLPPAITGMGEAEGAPAPPDRKTDLVLSLPFRSELRYRIVPPDGFRARPLPKAAEERFGPATFAQAFALEPGGAVTARFRFDSGARRLAAADASALARRVRAIVRGTGPRIAFERTAAALLAAGQVPEALAELRRLAAAHPRRAKHRLHLALALLQLGTQEAALAEARAGVALEPGRAWPLRVLGYVLEHDAVGRTHGPGFDRAAAIDAYRRATELDPRHAGGRAALAELLAYAPSGVRHGPGADLRGAIEAYRALRDDLGDHRFDAGLLAALVAAGQQREAAELGRGMEPAPERDALLVAAVAATEGAEAAVDAVPAGEARRAALHGASQLLARDRRYPLAASLAAEAARGAPNAAELRSQAETFAALRPWKVQVEAGSEPERFVKRLLAAAIAAPDPSKAVGPLLSARAVELFGREAVEAGLPLSAAAARRAELEGGAPPEVLLDLVLSRIELVVDGEPATGLRVRIRSPFAPAERGAVAFLVRERGGLRFLGTDLAWPILGGEALRLADAGDLGAARRWLGWAREALPGEDGDAASPKGVLAALLPAGVLGERAALRRAGAALLAHADKTGRTLPLLVEATAAAPAGAERRALRFATLRAQRAAGRTEEMLASARALLAEDPGSRDAFAAAAWALQKLKRPAELEAAATAILARLPGDPEVLSVVGTARLALGDLTGASRAWRQLIDAGTATPLVYNNAAWLELFAPAPGPATLDWARRAVDQDRERSPASLNTLAAVHATLGRPGEAREVFLASIGGRPPASADWYVFGRIAEAWGLADAARAAYARVGEDELDGAPDPSGPHVLARRRLAALAPAASR